MGISYIRKKNYQSVKHIFFPTHHPDSSATQPVKSCCINPHDTSCLAAVSSWVHILRTFNLSWKSCCFTYSTW